MTDPNAIAVIGMSGRFPGAPDLDAYWSNLRAGRCCVAELADTDLRAAGVPATELARADYVRAKGMLADADRFEAELFGVNPADARLLDPQHRVLLETAWSALEHAGYDPAHAPSATGVYVGGSVTEHALAAQTDPHLDEEVGGLGVRILTSQEFLASWLSYRLNLGGPSLTVQAACASSLAAVHLAGQALLLGECDTALAGGVSIDSVRPRGHRYRPGGILSPDGHCRPFDERAAGTVVGNGAGLIVLRRLADALADGDPVQAVILGSALTNDGSAKVGFTAPSVARQTAACVEAWVAAGLSPSAAQYIEMHGTGTRVGDRIEIAAVSAALAGGGEDRRCGIGSVKAGIGHLDAAAGIAGLIKTVLMLQHRTLVASPGVNRPHPDLGLDQTPLRLVTDTESWPRPPDLPRLAGVSSVGIGGTNVHVALSEAPQSHHATTSGAVELLPLSARTDGQLGEAARRLAAVLRAPDAPPLREVAHTLRVGRAALGCRGYVLAASVGEAADALDAISAGRRQRATPDGPLAELATRWMAGEEIIWPVAEHRRIRRVPLPTYPFRGEHRGALWLDPQHPARDVPAPGVVFEVKPADTAAAGNAGSCGVNGMQVRGEALAEAVIALLAEALGLPAPIEEDQSFFNAGGDSLTAVQVVGRIRDDFGVDVPVESVLEQLTLREFASHVRTAAERAAANGDMLGALLDEIGA